MYMIVDEWQHFTSSVSLQKNVTKEYNRKLIGTYLVCEEHKSFIVTESDDVSYILCRKVLT